MAFERQGLYFREVEYLDLPLLRGWRNDDRMTAGWHDPSSVQTIEQQTKWYKTLDYTNQAYLVFPERQPFHLPSSDDFGPEIARKYVPVTSVGLLRFRLDSVNNEARITGIDVNPGTHGKGYGRRILRAGVEYVLNDLGYHRATGEAMDGNTGAIKIILAAGMKQEGTLRKYVWRKGAWQDWHIYSILREELWPEETKGLQGV